MYLISIPYRFFRAVFTSQNLPQIVVLTSISFCLSLLMLPDSSFAALDVRVTGQVTDTTGAPIPGAHVMVTGLQAGAVSGWNGEYKLRNIPSGTYTVVASHLGFENSTIYSVRVDEGLAVHTNFILKPEPLRFPPTIVNVPRFPRNLVIKDKVIVERSSWSERGATNVGDAIRYIPGVSILEGDNSQRISLRGSPARTVKVFLDGIPLNDAGIGEADVNRIDVDCIQMIEIQFSGLGGSVNLLTRSPESSIDTLRRISMGIGTMSQSGKTYQLGLRSGSGHRREFINVQQTTDRGDFTYALDNGSSGTRVNNAVRNFRGIAKFEQLSQSWDFDVGLHIDREHRGIPGLLYSGPTPEATLSRDRLSLGMSARSSIGRTDIQLTGYYSDYGSHFNNPAEQIDPTTGELSRHIAEDSEQIGLKYGFGSELNQRSQNRILTTAYSFQGDEYIGRDLLRNRITLAGLGLGEAWRNQHEVRAGWKQWFMNSGFIYTLSPQMSLSGISESDDRHYIFTAPSVSFSVERRFRSFSSTLTGGWGRSFSAPPFNARFTIESVYAIGNRDLKPEKGERYNLGILTVSNGSKWLAWHAGVNWSQGSTEDLIVWQRNFQGKYYPTNHHRTLSDRLETNLNLDFLRGRISLFNSYIYHDERIDTPGDINRGNRIPLIPMHSGSSSLTGRYDGVSVSLTARWAQRRFSTASNQDPKSTAGMGLPPYTVVDLYAMNNLKWGSSSFTLKAGIDNLFNRSYRVIERSPMPGRQFNISLTYSI